VELELFVKDVRDQQGKKRPLKVRSWCTIKDVKDILQKRLGVHPSAQRLFFGPIELPNYRTLVDAGIYKSGETLFLDYKTPQNAPLAYSSPLSEGTMSQVGPDVCVASTMIDSTPSRLRTIVRQARRGLVVNNLKPDLVLDGSGGTYFLHSSPKQRVAVFKPADEEPYAPNNPRGYLPQGGGGSGLRDGMLPGEGYLREVAAYLLDHGGFSGVPMTTLVEASHPAFNSNGRSLKLTEGGASVGSHVLTSLPSSSRSINIERKVGSFQQYVHAECTMDDISFSKLSQHEVEKIAILDIRIMNADRNSANLLCRRRPEDDEFELVPIDHGFCLRSVCDVAWFDWCWLDWPQLKQPLSQKSRDYILSLNIEADVRLLQERFHLKTEAISYFRASSKLLQVGVQAGLTLYEIACMCCRNDDSGEIPSKLEAWGSMASELASLAVGNGRFHHIDASRALAEQITSRTPVTQTPVSVPVKSGLFRKSASSVTFSSSFMGREDSNNDVGIGSDGHVPAMTQSTVSDTSSEHEDHLVEENEVEEDDWVVDSFGDDDCDKWAANTYTDISLNTSMIAAFPKNRSSSIGSDDSSAGDSDCSESNMLSKSPKGFWTVRPGSTKSCLQEKDTLWTSEPSPRVSVIQTLPRCSFRRPSSWGTSDNEEGSSLSQKSINFPPPPPLMLEKEFSAEKDSTSALPIKESSSHTAFTEQKNRGLVRSKSLASFSSQLDSKRFSSFGTPSAIEKEQYELNFIKFVDLLIVGETAALHRNSLERKKNSSFDVSKGQPLWSKMPSQVNSLVYA